MLCLSTAAMADENLIGISWNDSASEESIASIASLTATLDAQGDRYIFLDAESSSSKQAADILSLIEMEIDALIVFPQDPLALQSIIEQALAQNIRVVSIDVPIENQDVFYIGFDSEEIGRIQAQALLNVVPNGNYAFVYGDRSDPSLSAFRRGQEEVLREAIAGGQITVVAETYAEFWLPANAQLEMQSVLMSNNNNVDAVLAWNDSIAGGVISALALEGLAGTPVSGQGGDIEALKRVANGLQTVTAWSDPREIGFNAASVASMLADGMDASTIQKVQRFSLSQSPGGMPLQVNSILIQPSSITQQNLEAVTDTGWITAEILCAGASEGVASICRDLDTDLPIIDVCFGTDRSQQVTNDKLVFDHGRASILTLGFARVSIPEDVHEFGSRERPEKERFLFFDLGRYETEDENEHFVIQEIDTLSTFAMETRSEEILRNSNFYKNHVVVFIHGFNVAFDEAIYSAAQIAWDINFDGLPCIYSWPSMGEMSLTAYTYDTNSAQQTRDQLAEFLEFILQIEGADSVSLIAHSMGNVALIEALRELQLPNETEVKPFSEIILAAPDLDRDNFISLTPILSRFAAGVTLYASANDRALEASKTLAASIPRAGDVPESGPVVVPLIDSIDASAVSSYVFGINHRYFATNRSVISDIGRLIQYSARPPTIRDATLRPSYNANGDQYWKFPD